MGPDGIVCPVLVAEHRSMANEGGIATFSIMLHGRNGFEDRFF
jgi:hypothetical protein